MCRCENPGSTIFTAFMWLQQIVYFSAVFLTKSCNFLKLIWHTCLNLTDHKLWRVCLHSVHWHNLGSMACAPARELVGTCCCSCVVCLAVMSKNVFLPVSASRPTWVFNCWMLSTVWELLFQPWSSCKIFPDGWRGRFAGLAQKCDNPMLHRTPACRISLL